MEGRGGRERGERERKRQRVSSVYLRGVVEPDRILIRIMPTFLAQLEKPGLRSKEDRLFQGGAAVSDLEKDADYQKVKHILGAA